MTKGSIDSIETMGLVDGPGVRFVVFLQGCRLRCLFCHNPETWDMKEKNLRTPEELVSKIKRYQNYFGEDGGVTFSGGEPLCQPEFLLETLKLCKEEGIHTCLDTSGVGVNPNLHEEILNNTDLVIFDIKALDESSYEKMAGQKMNDSLHFLDLCQEMNKKMW
ncbi:MAG: radical SAM protein, partial [Firmicutes bacterium]|nr:radical SAM protein [Bacillota bacterium]